MLDKILNLSRDNKKLLIMVIDSFAIILILILSFKVRLGFDYYPNNELLWIILGAPIIAIPVFIRFCLPIAIAIRVLSCSWGNFDHSPV